MKTLTWIMKAIAINHNLDEETVLDCVGCSNRSTSRRLCHGSHLAVQSIGTWMMMDTVLAVAIHQQLDEDIVLVDHTWL